MFVLIVFCGDFLFSQEQTTWETNLNITIGEEYAPFGVGWNLLYKINDIQIGGEVGISPLGDGWGLSSFMDYIYYSLQVRSKININFRNLTWQNFVGVRFEIEKFGFTPMVGYEIEIHRFPQTTESIDFLNRMTSLFNKLSFSVLVRPFL